ncbi:MAG: glycosyltransferase [Patescibacteria group bacterium]|nr:glycosyltransferase [Patescibacteria group bacterium]
MKIAIFHGLHNGGARRAVNELAKRLKKNNIVDLYIVEDKQNKEEKTFFSNVFFYKFIPKKWSGGNWKVRLYKDTVELYKLYRLHKKIAHDIDSKKYDIAFVHPSKYTQAPFILRFLNTKKVYYCQESLRIVYEEIFKTQQDANFLKKIYGEIVRAIRKKIDRKNIINANLVLSNSKFTQKNVKSIYGIESKVAFLGVDTDFFVPAKLKKNTDVLYIGSKEKNEGFELLRDAISLMSKKPIVKCHMTDQNWIDDEELRQLYRGSKLVVCLAQNEPFGLIPLESAACGVPVIVLNSGGYRETVINQETGLFTSRDPKNLAKKITTLLLNKKKLERMGLKARENVVSYWTWDRSVKHIEKIITGNGSIQSKFSSSSNNTINKSRMKIIAVVLIFLFSILLRLSTLNQIGRTWDEYEYVEQGYKLTELIKNGDFNNNYFYTTYDHPPLVKYIYGISAHFDVEKIINNKPVFNYDLTNSRLLSSLMFSLGVVVVILIGWKIFSPIVGIISGIILSMLPFTLGLSQLVTTESLKILVYPLVILSYIALIKKFSVKKVFIAGILTGIAFQAKQSNALLILILATSFFLQCRTLSAKEKIGFIKVRLLAILTIITIGIIVFILIWPQVLFHFREVYDVNQKLWSVQFSPKLWQITLAPPEVFFGRLMLAPIFYYIVYFLITIPVIILFLFVFGVKNIVKSKNLYRYIILLWFIFPFSMSIYSWRQHGLRYIIEVYPAIALIAAVGFDAFVQRFTRNQFKKFLYFIPIIVYLLISLWYVKPYYLDYFNEVVGGTETVYRSNLFQTGWWGQGEREAGLFLKNSAPQGSNVGLALSPEHTFPRFESLKYSMWAENKKYDFVVVNNYHIIRDSFDDSAIRKNYNLVYQVKADGATLVYVYKSK